MSKRTFLAKSAQEWHSWLVDNHQREKEIWLIFYKKNCYKTAISYDDALDEALCFGWIDSIIQRVDDEKYIRKFTPRINTKKWSQANIKRVKNLIESGRMNEIGLAKIADLHLIEEDLEPTKAEPFRIPVKIEQSVQANEKAWISYLKLSPSSRKRYFGWVMNAKRAETLQ